MRSLLFVALLVSIPLASNACLNDRDSDALAVQNNRFPDALRVISGRFERNPPRFYQMRVARVEAELKSKPRDFGLYDDLAVAHDKLGDSQAALNVMAKKRALLPIYNARDKASREAWYRFFANDGTFRAHRFLHDGAKVQNIGDMKAARSEIKRAIEVKPNAHFGRERVQLMVMDWIVATKQSKTKKTLGEWLQGRDDWATSDYWESVSRYKPEPKVIWRRTRTAEGLTGLIALGAAWQSPDVFEALGAALASRHTVALRYVALLRCRELLQSGRPSMAYLSVAQINQLLEETGNDGLEMAGIGVNATNRKTLDQLYPKLRSEADSWNASRAGWMETRFTQNQHPDTNAAFWTGWESAAPPSLDVAWFDHDAERKRGRRNNLIEMIGVWSATLIFCAVISVLFLKLNRRFKANSST